MITSEVTEVLVTLQQLDDAFKWLCQQRRHFPPDTDIWSFRRDYSDQKRRLLASINAGRYRFSVQTKVVKADGSVIHLWSSADALVMKCLSQSLQTMIQPARSCTHVKGHGGLKQSIVQVQQHLQDYTFVCKTDVYHFYESIDHFQLSNMICDAIESPIMRNYLHQVIYRCVEWGGIYTDIDRGISRGSPLSPLPVIVKIVVA